ncbi:MAG: glycosyltransferase family 2 protein [Deinococcus sp.]|nr:glycosyltransferase family 2 protein [Deinococcus sp.]
MGRQLSVIVPAYNEAERIYLNLAETARALQELGLDSEIIAVDDGSTDSTFAELQRAEREIPQVRAIGYRFNAGKGSALLSGLKFATGELVAFCDCDLDIHPSQLKSFLVMQREFDADVVNGSKRHPASQVHYSAQRRLLSAGYYFLVRLLFRLPVRDTQTGLKLFKRSVLEDVARRVLVKRFAFDLELLAVAYHLGYRRIFEVPVVVHNRRYLGRIRFRDALVVWLDTLAVFYRLYLRRYYHRVGRAAQAPSALAPGASNGLPLPLEDQGLSHYQKADS